jgi:hypothetical protein
MNIKPTKEEITTFVETHATFWQDETVDYPSFVYQVIWKGKIYTERSKEEIINEITKEEKTKPVEISLEIWNKIQYFLYYLIEFDQSDKKEINGLIQTINKDNKISKEEEQS